MGTKAIDGAKRTDSFAFDPFALKLAGIDFKTTADDPLYMNALRNKTPLRAEFVESIARNGVLEPIQVIKRGDDIVVENGNTRVRAAREVTLRLRKQGDKKAVVLVPSKAPGRGASEEQLSEAIIATNEHRVESSPIVKAELAAVHLKRLAGDVSEARKAFGLSATAFNQLLLLHEAIPAVKSAVIDGHLSAAAAIELAAIPREKQAEKLAKVLAAGGTREKAKTERKKAEGKAGSGKPTPTIIREVKDRMADGGTLHGGGSWDAGFASALAWVLGENAVIAPRIGRLLEEDEADSDLGRWHDDGGSAANG